MIDYIFTYEFSRYTAQKNTKSSLISIFNNNEHNAVLSGADESSVGFGHVFNWT